MSRWIEEKWLNKRIKDSYRERIGLDSAPSIDIVRCGECKYWHELIDAKGQGRCDADEHNPFRVSIGISYADFFCSYGEREGE